MTVAREYIVYLDSFETFCPLVQAPALSDAFPEYLDVALVGVRP
jgi:hypothetical protein